MTATEGPRDSIGEFFDSLGAGFYWAVTTVMGSGDASYVTTPAGYFVSWLLVLFGARLADLATPPDQLPLLTDAKKQESE